jgi:hypothetical protein
MESVSYAALVRSRWLVICVALAAGCRDPELTQLEQIKSEVCACKTASCGEEALKRVPQNEVASTHRSQTIAREMIDCLAKLYEAERPTNDPDAPAPGPASAAPGSGATP